MAIYKCKMCGASLNVNQGDKVVECEFCGTSQTIATSNDDKILKLFARGNNLRNECEFDKAYNIFEQIIAENADAESYWNLVLCKYGITYVDDYDGKKKPTINRMSMDSILDDSDYKKVLELSDVVAKDTYIKEANAISKIQERILEIVKSEEPYDIFISYKETDEFGDRTQDSVLAQEIYDTLTKEGYKVFLSRITLTSMAGQEYEPYIYSALYSAKMMILVTTSEEYVNAVWVKNEWSRFIGMMKKDSNKKIVPCFKDMDPYDLPKEFKNFQGIDMGKLGYIQDLVIGVNKVLDKNKCITKQESSKDKSQQLIENGLSIIIKGYLDKREIEKLNKIYNTLIDLDSGNPYNLLFDFVIRMHSDSFNGYILDELREKEEFDLINIAFNTMLNLAKKETTFFLNADHNSLSFSSIVSFLSENSYKYSYLFEVIMDNYDILNEDVKKEFDELFKKMKIRSLEFINNLYDYLMEYCKNNKFEGYDFEEKLYKLVNDFDMLLELDLSIYLNENDTIEIYEKIFYWIKNNIYKIESSNSRIKESFLDRLYKIIKINDNQKKIIQSEIDTFDDKNILYVLNDLWVLNKQIEMNLYKNKIVIKSDVKEVIIKCKDIFFVNLSMTSYRDNYGKIKITDWWDIVYKINENEYTLFHFSHNEKNYYSCDTKPSEVFINWSIKANIKYQHQMYEGSNPFINGLDSLMYVNTMNSFNNHNSLSSNGGCYIATCVYGSYDCKEVWSLRRYRDNYLDTFLLGRLFIKLYYKVSPTLVKLLGNKPLFRTLMKRVLDKKIDKLKHAGYEDTPYNDKY